MFSDKERNRRRTCFDLAIPKVLIFFSCFSPTVLHLHLVFHSWFYFCSAGCWIRDRKQSTSKQDLRKKEVKEENSYLFIYPPLWDCNSVELLMIMALTRARGTEVERVSEKKEQMRQSETPLSITLFNACYRNPSIHIEQVFLETVD